MIAKDEYETIIDRQLLAYNNRDIEGIISTYSRDIEFRRLKSNELIIKGHDEVREYHPKFLFCHKELHAKIVNRFVIGNIVCDHEEVSGIVDGEIIQALTIYEIKHNKIFRIWVQNIKNGEAILGALNGE